MDATAILNRAFAIVRQGRVLWIFAFLAALFERSVSIQPPSGGNVNFQFGARQPTGPMDQPDIWPAIIPLLIAFGVVLALFSILAFFLAPLVRGGLFATTDGVGSGEEPSFGEAIGAAGRRYGSLLLVQLLELIVPAVMAIVITVATIPLVIFIVGVASDASPAGRGPAIAGLAVFGVIFFIVLFALILIALVATAILQAIVLFASLRLVVEGGSAGEAIRTAWLLIRANAGTMLVVIIGFGVLTSLATLVIVFPLSVFATLPLAFSRGFPNVAAILGIGLLAIPLTAAVMTPVQALRYATFNVLYRDWTAAPTEA